MPRCPRAESGAAHCGASLTPKMKSSRIVMTNGEVAQVHDSERDPVLMHSYKFRKTTGHLSLRYLRSVIRSLGSEVTHKCVQRR